MERIYFDKQIFSHLFRNTDPKYQQLLAVLKMNLDNFLYCFSHAHMLDLRNDKTDIKYAELKFMETLVKDNYICHYFGDKITTCHLRTPSEAFENMSEEDSNDMSLATIFDEIDLESLDAEKREEIFKAKDVLLNLELDFGFLNSHEIPEEIKGPLSTILPIGMEPMTIQQLLDYSMGTIRSMEEDRAVYKGVRNIVDQHLNNGKFSVDEDSIDFNDDLKNSVLKKTFIEYVNGNLNPNGDKEVTDFDFFSNAYFTLDILGISKDASKTVKFRNVLNDSQHSFYGSLCDYVISDDDAFLRKSRALYKLLGIQTKVYGIDEFIGQFPLLASNGESSAETFLDLLDNDLKNGFVINSKRHISVNREITTIKPYHHYLGYFDRIDVVTGEDEYFVHLYRSKTNNSKFYFFRELEGLANKAVQIFGADHHFKSEYKWPDENIIVEGETWKGRNWEFKEASIYLEINSGTRKLCFVVSPRN